MLIPSIDLLDGKIVQLVQGKKKALESDDFDYWIERFSSHPLVQLIDLDAALGQGNNHSLIEMICKRLPCQVGGGIRSIGQGKALFDAGARRIILGSVLLQSGRVNAEVAEEYSENLGMGRLTFAIDSRGGKVAIQGWKDTTAFEPLEILSALGPYCSAFLYTHIDTEGTMSGFPIETARNLREATTRRLIVAGGIRSVEEVRTLEGLGVDAVVGMAIYTGAINEGGVGE
ncbi:MAG TPA: 1-(5-phosphoribosyl)-5-[(5-phosphoribosylamino)methylideneamino] imidazole-4-carboxamide isomerase [Candidatus Angelobacter sp.]|nr:1-(5-phosphoribosyl)-5-[(5-phosphoribosylamino)methylideneamino] imidazole-4-carboxamide isomerase [Candidatus Angelobacter sp.]